MPQTRRVRRGPVNAARTTPRPSARSWRVPLLATAPGLGGACDVSVSLTSRAVATTDPAGVGGASALLGDQIDARSGPDLLAPDKMGLRLCQTGPQGALPCRSDAIFPFRSRARRCRGVAASTATVGGREMNAPTQVAVAASGARQAKTTEPPCYCRGLVGTSSFLPLRCSRDHGEARTGQGRMGSPTTAPSPHSWRFSLIRGPQPQHNYCRREEAGGRRELGGGEAPPEFAYPHQRLRFLSVLAFWSCATMIAMQKILSCQRTRLWNVGGAT